MSALSLLSSLAAGSARISGSNTTKHKRRRLWNTDQDEDRDTEDDHGKTNENNFTAIAAPAAATATATDATLTVSCTLAELKVLITETVEAALRQSELRQARTIQETVQASEHRQNTSRKVDRTAVLAAIDRQNTSRKAWEQRQGESEQRIRQDLTAVLAAMDRQNTSRKAWEQRQGESELRQIRTIQETLQASELRQARMIQESLQASEYRQDKVRKDWEQRQGESEQRIRQDLTVLKNRQNKSRKAWEQRQGESEHRIRQDLSAVLAALEVVVEETEEEEEEEGEGVEDENEEENEEEEKDEEELLNSRKIAPTKNEELLQQEYNKHNEDQDTINRRRGGTTSKPTSSSSSSLMNQSLITSIHTGNRSTHCGWNFNYTALKDYLQAHQGIYPRHRTPLDRWCTYQHNSYNTTPHHRTLTPQMIAALERLPNWFWRTQATENSTTPTATTISTTNAPTNNSQQKVKSTAPKSIFDALHESKDWSAMLVSSSLLSLASSKKESPSMPPHPLVEYFKQERATKPRGYLRTECWKHVTNPAIDTVLSDVDYDDDDDFYRSTLSCSSYKVLKKIRNTPLSLFEKKVILSIDTILRSFYRNVFNCHATAADHDYGWGNFNDMYAYHFGREGMEARDFKTGELLVTQQVTDTNHDLDAPKSRFTILIEFPLEDDDDNRDNVCKDCDDNGCKISDLNDDNTKTKNEAVNSIIKSPEKAIYRENISWDLLDKNTPTPIIFASSIGREYGLTFGQTMDLASSIDQQIEDHIVASSQFREPITVDGPQNQCKGPMEPEDSQQENVILEHKARKLEKEAIAKEKQLEREARKLEKELERVAPKKRAAAPKKKPAPTYGQIQQEVAAASKKKLAPTYEQIQQEIAAAPKKKPAPTYEQIQQEIARHQAKVFLGRKTEIAGHQVKVRRKTTSNTRERERERERKRLFPYLYK